MLATVLSFALMIGGIDVVVLQARLQHLAFTPTTGAPGETWLIVGSDSRADLPAGAAQSSFGSPQQVAGARADIVLIVHRTPAGPLSTLSIPRDLLVHNQSGQINRLALAYQLSPQNLVDSLCATLNVPTDHLVVVDFAVFTAVVDALHGITVTVPAPLRDSLSGLDLNSAGAQRINGDQALALVRSRHTEQYVDGQWAPMPDGANQRTSWAGLIFSATTQLATATTNPLVLQQLAWNVGAGLEVDRGTSLTDLAMLAQDSGRLTDVATDLVPGGLARAPSAQTFSTLSAAGFDSPCR